MDATRRKQERTRMTIPVEWSESGAATRSRSTLEDLSDEGMFVRTSIPAAKGAKIDVRIRTGIGILDAVGKVMWSQDGLGMGLAILPLPQ